MAFVPSVRKRLEIQGFTDLSESDIASLGPWLRLAPAICAVVTGIGTALASPLILGVMAILAGLGAILPFHPFDLIYSQGIRRLTGGQPLPSNGPPRRFACGMAAVWLGATAIAFMSDIAVVGYVLGGILTGVAGLLALTHFCIPSLMYGVLFGNLLFRRSRA